MNIVKIPCPRRTRNDGLSPPWVKTIEIKKWLTEQGLSDEIDFDCHYMTGAEHIHVKFWSDDTESVASMLALKYL